MFHKLALGALVALEIGAATIAAQFVRSALAADPLLPARCEALQTSAPLGTVRLADPFASAFALNGDDTWVGLPNATGGPSFFCYSLEPSIAYVSGAWAFDPRVPAVNLYGPDGAPLATLHGLRPSVRAAQGGAVSGCHCGPAPDWSFLP